MRNRTTTSPADKQSITGDGGTGYTLNHAVANVQEIEVFEQCQAGAGNVGVRHYADDDRHRH